MRPGKGSKCERCERIRNCRFENAESEDTQLRNPQLKNTQHSNAQFNNRISDTKCDFVPQLNWSSYPHRMRIIDAYVKKFQGYIDNGWNGYVLTFMFNQLPGSMNAKVMQMQQEIMKAYSKLVTRMVRKPRSPAWADLLAIAIVVPDLPVPKRSKQDIRDVSINDGLHHHGILVSPPCSRITEPLEIHFQKQRRLYLSGSRALRDIHIQPILYNFAETVEYAMKSLKRGRFSDNRILLLPRSRSELPDKGFSTAHG